MKNKLSEGWKEVELGEVADIIMGQSPPSDTYNEKQEGLPFFQGKAEFGTRFPEVRKYCSKPVRIAEQNDILMSVRAPVGSLNIANQKCCIGRGLCSIKPSNSLNYLFVYHFLKSIERGISEKGEGSTFTAINRKVIESIEIPVPPLLIQQKIVSILERAENLKQKREQADEEANKIIQSIFYKMFGDSAYYEKSGNLKKLGDMCLFVRGPFLGSLKKEIFKDQGYAVYEQQHAIGDNFTDIRYFIADEKFNEMKRFELNSGDLIMSCSGTMGKIAIVPPGIKKGIINQALLKLTPNKNLSRVFLKYWRESKSFQNSLKLFSQGAAIQNVASVKILKEIKIPLPSMNIQNQFASIVEKIESIKQKQSKATEEINTLFDALMQKAFKGELVD